MILFIFQSSDSILSDGLTYIDYLRSGVVLLVSILLAFLTRRIILFCSKRIKWKEGTLNVLSRLIAGVILMFGLYYALVGLGVKVGPIVGTLGVGGVAIAFALQNLILNLLGSFLIHTRKPFVTGDQIIVGNHRGTVIDINTRTVVLKDFDGNHVHVPNSKIMDDAFVNRTTESTRRTEGTVAVAYDSDLEEALAVIRKALRDTSGVTDHMLAEAHVTSFADSGVNITYRFWHPSEQLAANQVVSSVAISVHKALRENNITIPFPQIVVHNSQGNKGLLVNEDTKA